MNLDEAFSKWYAAQDHSGLPWQTSRDELFNVFYAGWHAHIEAIKQTDLFPGTWNKDGMEPAKRDRAYEAAAKELFPANEAQRAEHPPCKREAVGSSPTVGSITAEDIYAAYPRKVGKQAAIKAIQRAIKADRRPYDDRSAEEYLLFCTKAYAAAVAKWPAADKQFIPFPATWFNRGSYDDNPQEWIRGSAATSQFSKTH